MQTKICSKCGQEKTLDSSNFRKHCQSKDGYRPDCKECQRQQWKINYPNIAERHRKRTKQYAEDHKDQCIRKRREYYHANRELFCEKTRIWSSKNRFKRVCNHKYWKAKSKAELFGVTSNLTYEQVTELFQDHNGICAYCGKQFDKLDLTIDHVVPFKSGGSNSLDNIRVCCMDCNTIKGDRELSVFLQYLGGLNGKH